MIPKEITEDLRNGMGLEECLIKHNTNLKSLFESTYSLERTHVEETKYIEYKGKTFYVKRKIKSKTYYYGGYSSLKDAQKVRDKLELVGWRQDKVDAICKRLGITRVPSRNEHRYYEGVK